MTPEASSLIPTDVVGDIKPRWTESEVHLFKLKQHAIRRSLSSLAKKSRKIQQRRHRERGARNGLRDIRAQTTALLMIYRKLKGQQDDVMPKLKNLGKDRGYVKHFNEWVTKYSEMFLDGATFELRGTYRV